jgi:hypothetical protein
MIEMGWMSFEGSRRMVIRSKWMLEEDACVVRDDTGISLTGTRMTDDDDDVGEFRDRVHRK